MNFVRALKKLGEVDIAYSGTNMQSGTNQKIFGKEYCLEQISYPINIMGRLCYSMRNVPYPLYIYKGQVANDLIDHINSGYYTHVLVRYLQNTTILKRIHRNYIHKVIVDIDDIMTESLYDSLFYESSNGLKKLTRLVNKYFLKKYQENVITKFKTAFCSESDKERHASGINTARFIPNIYENEKMSCFPFDEGYEKENTILFVGMLSYRPNVEGLKWFLDTIYKEFSRIVGDARLLVVGRSPTDEVINICEREESIQLHSNVESLIPYYNSSRVVVVPLRQGGGTRIKLLEAGLTKRPVLSTVIGAYGLNLTDGENILFFENADEFIRQYNKLNNKDYYELVGNNLRRVIESRFSQTCFEQAFYQLLLDS